MKCIDYEIIQKYIDGETTNEETESITRHIDKCPKCANNITEQKKFADIIKREMESLVDISDEIPEFVNRRPRIWRQNLKIKHYLYAVSAACAIFAFIFFYSAKKSENEYRLIYSYYGEFDSNKPYSQQEIVIKIIDSKGKIVEFN